MSEEIYAKPFIDIMFELKVQKNGRKKSFCFLIILEFLTSGKKHYYYFFIIFLDIRYNLYDNL